MVKKQPSQLSDDQARDAILRHLYKVHKAARGPKAVALGIRDLQSALRPLGITQPQVNSNLDYLVQKEWVRRVVEDRSFKAPRGSIYTAARITYKISDIGIDHLEGASIYTSRDTFSRINITNIQGVTVVGSGNVVNTSQAQLSRALSELEDAVAQSPSLAEEDKLNVLGDIATIQGQISKTSPHTGVIRTIWSGIEKIVVAEEFAGFVARIGTLISHLAS